MTSSPAELHTKSADMPPQASIPDLATPFAISFSCRVRQLSTWIPPLALGASYFISSYVHRNSDAGPPALSSDAIGAMVILGWLIAASGTREPQAWSGIATSSRSSSYFLNDFLFTSSSVAGRSSADALIGVGGIALLQIAFAGTSANSALACLLVSLPLFFAASLQMDLARRFADRSLALILTGLVAIATLVHATNSSGAGFDRIGGLVFPVSGAVRAAEEPLGFELAARATLPGVLYDLALFAALLALRPIRARGSHEDRDRQ